VRRLANGSTAFEAAPLIKPPALRGVSDENGKRGGNPSALGWQGVWTNRRYSSWPSVWAFQNRH